MLSSTSVELKFEFNLYLNIFWAFQININYLTSYVHSIIRKINYKFLKSFKRQKQTPTKVPPRTTSPFSRGITYVILSLPFLKLCIREYICCINLNLTLRKKKKNDEEISHKHVLLLPAQCLKKAQFTYSWGNCTITVWPLAG